MNAVDGPRCLDDEFDLVDLYLGLRKHRRAMLVSFLVLCAIGVILALSFPQRYSYSAVLTIGGKLGGNGLQAVEAPESVMTSLRDAFLPAELDSSRFSKQRLPKIEVTVPKGADLVLLRAEGTSAEGVLLSQVMESGLDHIIERHAKLLDAQRATIKAGYELRIQAINERIKTLQVSLSTSGLTASDKALIQDQLQSLNQSRINLEQSLREALDALQPTELVHPPQRSSRPVGLSRVGVIVLSVLVALIGALLVGMLGIFSESIKQRQLSER